VKQLIESVLGGGGVMGERMRAFDWSTTALGPLEQWPQSLRICVRIMLGSAYPMAICWGPNHTHLYNDGQRVQVGSKDATALGRPTREVFPEAWEIVGPLLDSVLKGQAYTFTDKLFPVNRYNYLEECYYSVSYSPIPDDSGHIGGVFATGIETTERVIEDRRGQVLRDLASGTAEARSEDEVWRVSADTFAEHRLTIPFAFLYECRLTERKAYLVGTSVEPDTLDPAVIDCTRPNLWGFDTALAREGVVVELGQRASVLPTTSWPVPPEHAAVLPIRLREDNDTAGFLVLGIHPGRAFDDKYRQFVYRIAEQIAIGLANAHAFEQERQRAEALAEIDRAKTAFFSNISHEFRTPLTLMLAPLEEVLPEARERLSAERHEQLVAVRSNAFRLLKLVNALLDFSRIEAGRSEAVYQPTDLATFTSEIASAFESAMHNAGLRFSVECQPIGEPVYVDRDMWEKIVLNLLSNAFKFTFEGEVAVTLKPVDGSVELQVRDTGVGIAEKERERVFERFHRIEGIQARTYEGAGIGLALIHELVKLHGGKLSVESVLGQGSTFTVSIPPGKAHLPAERIQAARSFMSTGLRSEAYAEEAQRWLPEKPGDAFDVATLPKPASLVPLRQPESAEKRELIVLADDNAEMRRYLTHLLGDRYQVHAVVDGRQALEATRQFRPALVLADVMMPLLDGVGLLRAIRGDSALASTPLILLSARAGENARAEGLQADADDYLVKPFTARELVACVAMHLKMARLRRETAQYEERLRGEAELRRAYAQLTEAQRISHTGSFTWDVQADDHVWSEEIYRLFGFEPGTKITMQMIQSAIHSEDMPGVISVIGRAAEGRDFDIVFRIVTASGLVRHAHVVGHHIEQIDGRAVFIGALQDVTDSKLAEEALDKARSELAHVARVTMLNTFTASITHEVNQPLSGIITNASTCLRMLNGDFPNVEGAREATRRIIRDGNRASDVIKRLRPLFSKKEFTLEPLDLNEATREVIALSLSDLQRNRVILRSELADDLPPVTGDRIQLQQVILNLLRNASDAMVSVDDRPRELLIKTERDEGDQVRLSVKDVGIGFTAEARDKLFEAFYTTKNDGMGIGLSVSRSIIERHQGRLWARPNEGPGATFSFALPCGTDTKAQ
jgi:PAS domain S-box-containing protein